jgi:hypothetical protein
LYNKVPTNGLVIYCGTIVTGAAAGIVRVGHACAAKPRF